MTKRVKQVTNPWLPLNTQGRQDASTQNLTNKTKANTL